MRNNYRAAWRQHLGVSDQPLRRIEVADEGIDPVLFASIVDALRSLQDTVGRQEKAIAELTRRVRDLRSEAAA